jgi:hypothetical protein
MHREGRADRLAGARIERIEIVLGRDAAHYSDLFGCVRERNLSLGVRRDTVKLGP